MENWVFYFLGFGVMALGLVFGSFFFGVKDSYNKEMALLDALRPPRDPWETILKLRCSYCNSKVSVCTDRCTQCGAPHDAA